MIINPLQQSFAHSPKKKLFWTLHEELVPLEIWTVYGPSTLIGGDPSVCKSKRLHVDILRFSFIKLGYIL